MEAVQNWAFSVCCAAICGGLLNMILPEGSIQRTYKVVFCVFFLCVLVAPLSEIEIPDFDSIAKNFDETGTEEITENEFSQNSLAFIEEQIISDTEALLSENGVAAKDISIKVNISEDGSIDINKFILTFSSVENVEALKEKIIKTIGIEPKIIISGEN